MIEVFNLAGDDQVSFMPVMGTLWAVAYCYCEQHDKLHELFEEERLGRFIEYAKTLPVTVGDKSVACGDWVTVGHPSSSSLKLFGGERAMELAEGTKDREALTPDWETGRPYDWTALLDFIIAHARKKEHEP
jgi:hypothetical protein